MIEIKGLSKSFKGRVVLDDISANFQQGKTNMVIGGSGTGKSVLLKCMIGILVPETGKVLYDGRDFLTAHQDVVKEIRDAAAAGKGKEAQAKLSSAYKAIDKAAKRGVIKKNTASRKKARLAALIKKSK